MTDDKEEGPEYTTIQVYAKDKERFDKLKITHGEYDRDAFRRILGFEEIRVKKEASKVP